MTETAIVVPCFNEEKRLDCESFISAHQQIDDLHFVFVDDGSVDGTRALLDSLVSKLGNGRSQILALNDNVGKAEAVRLGVCRAVQGDVSSVGFWDADLSTPLDDISRFVDVLRNSSEVMAVIGSRIRLMGRQVERDEKRHYAGRVFATLASLALGFPVYDTQCGAKLFRVTPELRQLFGEPFRSRWAFDVEILARLASVYGSDLGDAGVVVEYPLTRWSDVAGSKVRLSDLPRMLFDLQRIFKQYR